LVLKNKGVTASLAAVGLIGYRLLYESMFGGIDHQSLFCRDSAGSNGNSSSSKTDDIQEYRDYRAGVLCARTTHPSVVFWQDVCVFTPGMSLVGVDEMVGGF